MPRALPPSQNCDDVDDERIISNGVSKYRNFDWIDIVDEGEHQCCFYVWRYLSCIQAFGILNEEFIQCCPQVSGTILTCTRTKSAMASAGTSHGKPSVTSGARQSMARSIASFSTASMTRAAEKTMATVTRDAISAGRKATRTEERSLGTSEFLIGATGIVK